MQHIPVDIASVSLYAEFFIFVYYIFGTILCECADGKFLLVPLLFSFFVLIRYVPIEGNNLYFMSFSFTSINEGMNISALF